MNKKIALAGNPNSGKTTLFNKLTGRNEYTGNRIGVTVEEKVSRMKSEDKYICDLPGIYSLSGYSEDEKRAVKYIFNEKPDVIINVLDGTNLARGLYLTLQLLKLNLPVICVINMKDECEKKRIKIDISGLSSELGIKFLFVSSKTGEGTEQIFDAVKYVKSLRISDYDRLMKRIYSIEQSFESEELNVVRANALYEYSDMLCKKYVKNEGQLIEITGKADRVILNRYLAYPIMLSVIFLGFFITFGPVGRYISEIFTFVCKMLLLNPVKYLSGFIKSDIIAVAVEGIVSGVESVAGFLPFVFILFFYTVFLEECGYMSRIAYISDKFMKGLGLSGKSVVPLILGFGCNTPAILASRVISSKRCRDKTICLIPFMVCSAKIPVVALFCGMFFKESYLSVVAFVYLLGVVSALVFSLITNRKKENKEDFILEMPAYRIPDFHLLFKSVMIKIKDFFMRTGLSVIVLSVLVCIFSNYSLSFVRADPKDSILVFIGNKIAPLFSPLGFGNAAASVALLSGVAAKEGIGASLGVLCGGFANIKSFFTPESALSFVVFSCFYLPCFSSFFAMAGEYKNKKWIILSFFLHTVYAYVLSFVVYKAAILLS